MTYYKYIYLLSIAIIYSFIFFISANNYPIDQNETWYFLEALYFHEGRVPYQDYFSHRLPLHQVVYSIWFDLTNPILLNARFLSVIFSVTTITITIFVITKITNDNFVYILSLLFFLTFTAINGLALNQIYPLTSLLYALSIFFIYMMRRNYEYSLIIFFILQFFILLTQYPISPQLILIFLFLLIVFSREIIEQDYHFKFYFFILVIIFTIGIGIYSFDINNIIYHTIIFNFNQIDEVINRSILPNELHSTFSRFFWQRKNEILQLLPYLPLILMTMIWSIINIFNLFKNWSKNWKYQIYLYSFIYFSAFYFPLMLYGYDFPITKVYALFPLLVMSSILISKLASYNIRAGYYIKVIIFLIFALFLFYQKSYIFQSSNDIEEQNKINKIISKLYKNGNVFSLDPLLAQENIKIDKNLSMSHYSFLHNLDEKESEKYHLAHMNNIKNNILNKKYEIIILNELNFYNERNKYNMSKIFETERNNILDIIIDNYSLIKEFNSSRFKGRYDIYKRND